MGSECVVLVIKSVKTSIVVHETAKSAKWFVFLLKILFINSFVLFGWEEGGESRKKKINHIYDNFSVIFHHPEFRFYLRVLMSL